MKQKEGSKFQTGNVITTSVAHFFHDVYSSFLAPVLPLLIENMGISMFQAGTLSVFQRIPTLFNPLIGILAEKVKSRFFVILTPAITAIVMSLIGLAPTYGILVIIMLIAGLSSAFFHVPSPVMIRKVSGNRPGFGMSLYMVGGELARTAGPLAIVGAVSLWGLQGTWTLMFFGIAASVVMYFRLKDIELRKDFSSNKQGKHYVKLFKTFLPMFGSISLFTFFFGAVKSSLTLFLPTYLKLEGYSLWVAGLSLSVLQFAGVAGTFFAGPIADRIGNWRLMRIVAVVTPILMLVFTQVSVGWGIPLLILTGIFLFAPGPVLLSVVNSSRTEHLTFLNGVYITINFFLNALMVMIIGWIADLIGLKNTYLLSVGIAFLAIPFIWRMKKESYTDEVSDLNTEDRDKK
jgi:FSR family fosmidomycin resistance protein-like MFS transporter